MSDHEQAFFPSSPRENQISDKFHPSDQSQSNNSNPSALDTPPLRQKSPESQTTTESSFSKPLNFSTKFSSIYEQTSVLIAEIKSKLSAFEQFQPKISKSSPASTHFDLQNQLGDAEIPEKELEPVLPSKKTRPTVRSMLTLSLDQIAFSKIQEKNAQNENGDQNPSSDKRSHSARHHRVEASATENKVEVKADKESSNEEELNVSDPEKDQTGALNSEKVRSLSGVDKTSYKALPLVSIEEEHHSDLQEFLQLESMHKDVSNPDLTMKELYVSYLQKDSNNSINFQASPRNNQNVQTNKQEAANSESQENPQKSERKLSKKANEERDYMPGSSPRAKISLIAYNASQSPTLENRSDKKESIISEGFTSACVFTENDEENNSNEKQCDEGGYRKTGTRAQTIKVKDFLKTVASSKTEIDLTADNPPSASKTEKKKNLGSSSKMSDNSEEMTKGLKVTVAQIKKDTPKSLPNKENNYELPREGKTPSSQGVTTPKVQKVMISLAPTENMLNISPEAKQNKTKLSASAQKPTSIQESQNNSPQREFPPSPQLKLGKNPGKSSSRPLSLSQTQKGSTSPGLKGKIPPKKGPFANKKSPETKKGKSSEYKAFEPILDMNQILGDSHAHPSGKFQSNTPSSISMIDETSQAPSLFDFDANYQFESQPTTTNDSLLKFITFSTTSLESKNESQPSGNSRHRNPKRSQTTQEARKSSVGHKRA